jgi:hypothetical protein
MPKQPSSSFLYATFHIIAKKLEIVLSNTIIIFFAEKKCPTLKNKISKNLKKSPDVYTWFQVG